MRIRGRIPTMFRVLKALVLTPVVLAGCGDSPSEADLTPMEEIGVVVNSRDISLTVFRVADPATPSTIGVGADGSPVTLAVRGATAVVPLGVAPAVAVVNLATGTVARTVALPEGSGATGVAFLNDSIAIVANPKLNSVSPINVRTGRRDEPVAVGGFPQAVLAVRDTAFVLNAELGADFQPTGPGTLSVLSGSPLRAVKRITLAGTNPGAAAVGPDGRIYVINAGRFGRNEGSLSVIDRGSLTEVAHHNGFGDFPGSIAIDSDGRAYVGGFRIGLIVWDSRGGRFLRGPTDPVAPGGIASVSGVGIDSQGRLYTLKPDCRNASQIFQLTGAYQVEVEIQAGTCPFGIAFTVMPVPDQ